MMINTNYTEIIAQAKVKGAAQINFEQPNYSVKAITAEKDTFTLSDAALAKMKGEPMKEITPIYPRPETAKALIAESEAANKVDSSAVAKSASDIRFDEMMQNILDKRLGVDREKLKEVEAMMAEVAKNENLSPEQKQKAMAELEKMKEQVIEESIEIKKQAKQVFPQEEKI